MVQREKRKINGGRVKKIVRILRTIRVLLHPYSEWKVIQAKQKHLKRHPHCAVCGMGPKMFGESVQVHHRIPVHVSPSAACDPFNLITLCAVHHFWIGHLNDYHDWNLNLNETIEKINEAYLKHAISALDNEVTDFRMLGT